MKGNPFSCLRSGTLDDRPQTNMEKHNMSSSSKSSKTKPKKTSRKQTKQNTKRIYSKSPEILSHKSQRYTDDQKQIPEIPSLNSAARSLLTEEPFVTSFINHEYQFVFRSRRIDSCQYEPYKILLFIASAHAFKTSDSKVSNIDPRLSPDGVSQCKIVSSALRKAKQSRPHLIYCSTLYRALSTMQLVCPDWYDDKVKIVGLDQLRPWIMDKKNRANKRSYINELKRAFKNVSFEYVDGDKDSLWKKTKMECEDSWKQRIHEFLTKFLIPENELIKTEYGTKSHNSFRNIGWHSELDKLKKNNEEDNDDILIQQRKKDMEISKYTSLFQKRVAIVSHCEFFEYLMEHVVDDVSPELMKKWNHCDLRKIFVYTKQQLGMNDIPYFSHSLIDRTSKRNNKKSKKKNVKRSRTPINTMSPRSQHVKSQSTALETSKIYNKYKNNNNVIRTTSKGDILMTNKSHNKYFPFESHTFTLTSESAAILKKRHSNDFGDEQRYSRRNNKENIDENKYEESDGSASDENKNDGNNRNQKVNNEKGKGCVIVITPPNTHNKGDGVKMSND